MNDIFPRAAEILEKKFAVDPGLIRPETTLDQLGLDSLALMEFVFEVEDEFDVRIPQEKLDPKQAGVTLAHLVDLLAAEMQSAATPAVEAKAA
jgi:acyl carrier protein